MEVAMHYKPKNLWHYVVISSANATVSTCKCESTKTVGHWLIILCTLSDILEIWNSLDFHQEWDLPPVGIICTKMYVFRHNLHYYVSNVHQTICKLMKRSNTFRVTPWCVSCCGCCFCFQPSCQSFVSCGIVQKLFEVRTSGIFLRYFPLAVACRPSCLLL